MQTGKSTDGIEGSGHGKGRKRERRGHCRDGGYSRWVSGDPSDRLVAVHPEDNRVRAAAGARWVTRRTGRRQLLGGGGHRGLVSIHENENWIGSAERPFRATGRRRRSFILEFVGHLGRFWVAVLWTGLHPRPSSGRSVLWLTILSFYLCGCCFSKCVKS